MFLDLFTDQNFPKKKPAAPQPAPRAEAGATSGEPHVFSVSELTRSVRALIEEEIGQVWVQGEICNYRRQSSGHQYFGLKDERATLSCVLFSRTLPARGRVELADGMLVQVRGAMTVYEARGQYQLNVQLVQPAGVGLLQAKFEALKRRLEAEGLFAAGRKKALPRFPAVVGIVTSPTGAAVRDVLNVLHRRAPWIHVLIHPARVQGEGAAAEIALAVEALNRFGLNGGPGPTVDVIVVCRGGGSAEDLWAFNEEIVARAIFASVIPVVSAVGHEIDFTISDFVADFRAPTPSAAAEIVAPDGAELARRSAQIAARLQRELANCVAKWRARISAVVRLPVFREPRRRLAECAQEIDRLEEALHESRARFFSEKRNRLSKASAALAVHRPDCTVAMHRQRLEALRERLALLARKSAEALRCRHEHAASLLRALSPQTVLARGYTISTLENGAVVTDPAQARRGAALVTITAKGKIRSVVD